MIGYRSRAFSRIPTGGNKDSSKGGSRASTKKTMDGFCCKDLHDICFD
jgi:hypothetical protein